MSYGRIKIYSDAKELTAANVVEEVINAYSLHCRNQADIKALWDCYRGKTKILNKTKESREEINHKINFFFSTSFPTSFATFLQIIPIPHSRNQKILMLDHEPVKLSLTCRCFRSMLIRNDWNIVD